MKKINWRPSALLLLAATILTSLASCSEENATVEEYVNWQVTNEAYFAKIYTQAVADSAGGARWKVMRKWSLNGGAAKATTDYVVAKVIASGDAVQARPIYTDTCLVSYRGWLLKSATSVNADDPELGNIFAQTFSGTYDPSTARPAKMGVSATRTTTTGTTSSAYSSNVTTADGLTTVLQEMRPGDHWRVYIPYEQWSNSSMFASVPAYSTLVMDLWLEDFYHAGETYVFK